jgi:hypothetical protein
MDRTQRLAWWCEEARRVVSEELERELDAVCSGDLQEVEGRRQQVLRVVGGALVGGLAHLRLAALAGQPVRCPQCGEATRYVAQRPRQWEGLVGPVRLCARAGPPRCGLGVGRPFKGRWSGDSPGGRVAACGRQGQVGPRVG